MFVLLYFYYYNFHHCINLLEAIIPTIKNDEFWKFDGAIEVQAKLKKKANTTDYNDILQDVVDNFEKITGVAIEKLFNPRGEYGEEMPLFDQNVVDSTIPALEEYLKNKYNFDIYVNENFLYDLDDKLSEFNPNYKNASLKKQKI